MNISNVFVLLSFIYFFFFFLQAYPNSHILAFFSFSFSHPLFPFYLSASLRFFRFSSFDFPYFLHLFDCTKVISKGVRVFVWTSATH